MDLLPGTRAPHAWLVRMDGPSSRILWVRSLGSVGSLDATAVPHLAVDGANQALYVGGATFLSIPPSGGGRGPSTVLRIDTDSGAVVWARAVPQATAVALQPTTGQPFVTGCVRAWRVPLYLSRVLWLSRSLSFPRISNANPPPSPHSTTTTTTTTTLHRTLLKPATGATASSNPLLAALPSTALNGDIYLARLGNGTGDITHAQTFGTGVANTPGVFFPRDIVSDGFGNLYLAGSHRTQPLTLNGARLAAVGTTEEAFAGRVVQVRGGRHTYNGINTCRVGLAGATPL
jgi:hypothetical protein